MKPTAAALTMAALVSANVAFTNTDRDYGSITAGQSFNLTWSGADGKACDILLKSGPSNNLKTVDTLTSGETNSYFVWSPPSSLSSCDQYAFEIVQGSDINYSPQFSIAGLKACVSSKTTGTTASSTFYSKSSGSSTPSGSPSITSSASASNTYGPLRNSTTTSGNTLQTTAAKHTTTAPGSKNTTPISNTNAGQRMACSPLVLVLAGIAGLLLF